MHYLSILLFILFNCINSPSTCAASTQLPLRIVHIEHKTIVKRMTGVELAAPSIAIKLVPAIATLIAATPLSPIICTGCAIAATGWALWSGFKQTQEKIKRNKAHELEQSQQKHSAQFGDDIAAPPDNSNVVVVGFYHPLVPEDPEKEESTTQQPYTRSQLTNPAHDINQFEKLEKTLQIEQFESIAGLTKHSLQRFLERNFEVEEAIELLTQPDMTKMQSNGAKVFLKQVRKDCYNFASVNLTKQKVITAIRHIGKKKLTQLAKRYGWIL